MALVSIAAQAAEPPLANEMDLLFVAGQSNAVGYDAKPGKALASEVDDKIMFWWRCGDPPPDKHDSTSGGQWTRLKPQPLGTPKTPRQGRQYGNFAQPEGGFGPEIGLARTVFGKQKKPLAVLKAAFSGTSMSRDWNHEDPGKGGSCYRALVHETRTAMAAGRKQGITFKPRALIWVQGESDANAQHAENYAKALGAMIKALRRDLQAPKLIVLVAVNTKFGGGRNKFMTTIVDQQKLTASLDPRCEYVDTSAASIANNAHYDSEGTLLVGRLFGESLLRLESRLRTQ